MLHSILLIYDINTVDTRNFIKGMKWRGISVQAVQRDVYDGTNPILSTTDHYAVILLDGATYNKDLPVGAQTALVNYVTSGGKFIGSEWGAYQVSLNRFALMIDLVLLQRTRSSTDRIAYVIDPAYASHPIFKGFTGLIAMPITSYNIGLVRQFGTGQQATVLATHFGETYAGIVVCELKKPDGTPGGKIVAFSHSGNYMAGVLSNKNVQRLYFNSIMW